MKVIFLDVDGVLNRDGTAERVGYYIGVDRALSDKLVAWLKERPEIKIVLSSTWRNSRKMWGNDFIHELIAAGIQWIGETPNSDGPRLRGDEIQRFLQDHPEITQYAILDDLLPCNFQERQRPFLVQTDERTGLEDKHLQELDDILA